MTLAEFLISIALLCQASDTASVCQKKMMHCFNDRNASKVFQCIKENLP